MFLYLDGKFVNASLVKEISRAQGTGKETKAIVTFADGSEQTLRCDTDFFDMLSDSVIPAPPGFKCISVFEGNDDEAEHLIQDVVAFRYSGPKNDLVPISVYNLEDQSVIIPDGKVVTPESGIDPDLKTFIDRKSRELSDLKRVAGKPS